MTRVIPGGVLLGLAQAAAFSSAGASQDVDRLAARCLVVASASATPCLEGAIAAQALLAQTGLLAGLGSEVAGSPSTLGRRVGSSPRIALSLRAGGLEARLPDITDRQNTPSREAVFFLPTVHGSVALGVFDGFRLRPTVGGFLSLDLLAQTSVIFFPEGRGFAGNVSALSVGLRVGVIRETFTLPGVTLSVSRRLLGVVRMADVPLGDPTQVEIAPTVSAYRLAVGKDLFAVGLLLGAGWDVYSTDARITVADDLRGIVTVEDSLKAQRALFFGSASWSLLVLQLSAELGWAHGVSSPAGYSGADFDPARGSWFGSLAARLTL